MVKSCTPTVRPKRFSLRLYTISINLCSGYSSSKIDTFVLCSVFTPIVLLYAVISKTVNLRLSARDSHQYSPTCYTNAAIIAFIQELALSAIQTGGAG